jgi:BASS family bile acid:Na+ symporter
MTPDRLINILVTGACIAMMVAVGLGVPLAELARVARDRRLVARTLLLNYVGVPAVALGLLFLLRAHPMVAAGFLILAACPGAPFGPPITAIARGNLAASAALMVILAGSSAVVAPFLLRLLLPLVSAGEPIGVDPVRIVGTLLVAQLIPLAIGLALRERLPALAIRMEGPAKLAAKVLGSLAVGSILVAQFSMLATIRATGFAGMLALLAASLAFGWLAGGPDRGGRTALALATSLRNVGVGLVIATTTFAGTPAVSAALAYGIVEILGSLLVAVWWGRRPAATIRFGEDLATPAGDQITAGTRSSPNGLPTAGLPT